MGPSSPLPTTAAALVSDDDLRALLRDAASDVEPARALDTIRTRTKVTPMSTRNAGPAGPRRPWIFAAVGAVAATAATITVVTVLGDDDPDPRRTSGPASSTSATPTPGEDATTSPSPSASPSAPASTGTPTAPASARSVPVYYVGDTPAGPRLFREFHRLQVPDDPAALGKAALV